LGQNKASVLPTARGFDSHFGYWAGEEDHVSHLQGQAIDFNKDGIPTTNFTGVWSTPLFTSTAIQIIQNYSESDQSMFLYVAFQDPHSPAQAPQRFIDMYASINDTVRKGVCAMGAHLDEAVLNITVALKNAGMWEDTIFIFANDNGGPTNSNVNNGGHTSDVNNINYPLRGGKDGLWQGSVRSLAFVRGWGIAQTGYHSDAYFHVTDWLATLVTAATKNINGSTWTDFTPSIDPAFAVGDGLNQWDVISTRAKSERDWVLLVS
jgi:arylsulfatase I/J